MGLATQQRLAAAAGALLAAFATAAIAAFAAPADPLQIQVGKTKDLSHIEFHWAGKAPFSAKRDGQTLTLHFARDADPNLSLLRVDPPPFLKTAELRRAKGAIDVVLTLQPGADAKTGEADGAVFVNLFPAPPPPDPPPVAAPVAAPRPDPRPASGVVRMKGEIVQGQILLHFAWRNPLGAAAFRRGEGVWLVFDTPVKLDVSGAPAQTPIFKGIKVVNGEGYSAIRVASPGDAAARAWAEGPVWTLAIGPGLQAWPTPIKAMRDDAAPLPTLKAELAGATKQVWVDDPEVGDRIGVVTALSPSKGLGSRRAFVDLSLMPSVQGLAFEDAADDLKVDIDSDWVRFTRPGGLMLSTAVKVAQRGDINLPQPAAMPALVDFANWSRTGPSGFMGRYGDLQNMAASEINREAGGDKQAGVKARMALARFLIGSELSYEAIGVLELTLRTHPEMASDPEFRGLRGAARAMVGRYKEADNDFSVPVLADDGASSLWRGYIAAKQGDWTAAKDAFVKGNKVMNQFAPAWQARFARAYAETAIQAGQLDVAATEIALSIAQTKAPDELLASQYLQARLLDAQGYPRRALTIYDQVSRSPLDQYAAPALLHATQIRLAQNQINAAQAEDAYDGLRYRWRGDATEVEVIRTLGQLYVGQGHYREALEVMRSASSIQTNSPQAVGLQGDLGKAFRALFLDGAADGMEPVQALALFNDFRDLTPVGADGDQMVRKMVQRLVDVDLLDQASTLLKYQVDNRLDGIAKADVSANLATLYLMDHKPEQAIEALNNSRTTILPAALANTRKMIEARAWLSVGQNDHALELIGKDATPDADDIRAEVAWRLHQWPQVGALMEKLLGDRWKTPGPLAAEEEARLLRAGIAYSLAADDASLERLRAHFEPMVDRAHSPEALRVALAGTAAMSGNLGTFTNIAAADDTFSGWVARMKQRFKAGPAPVVTPPKGKVASAATAAKG